MAIQYVGGVVGSRAGATSTTSQSLSGTLTGGIGTSPKPHDLVIITVVVGSAARNPTLSISTPADYTALAQLNPNTQSFDTSLCVSYKRMPVSGADTSVTIPSSGNNQDAQAWSVQVFRGVDFDSPLDVAAVSATGTGTTRANPASITPTTTDAVVVVCSGGAGGTTSALTYAGLSNVLSQAASDTNDVVVGSGWTTWTSGALDPAASSTGDATSTSSWAAYTLALRPLPAFSVPQDDFDDGSIAALWNAVPASGQTVTETGGVIEIALASVIDYSTFYIHDNGYYNLTGSRAFFRFVQPPQGLGGVNAGYEMFWRISDDTGTFLIDAMHWYTDGTATGTVEARYDNDGTGTVTIGSAVAYNPSTHAWWSIRESGGTVFIETAPDSASNPPVSGDWVSFASVSLATLAKPVTSLTFGFQAGAFTDPGTHPTGPGKIDGVNAAANSTSSNTNSTATPATYSLTGVSTTDTRQLQSQGNPATYALSASSGTDSKNDVDIASPATYSTSGVDAVSEVTATNGSSADPATYSLAGSSTTTSIVSKASPATYLTAGEDQTSNIASKTSPATYLTSGQSATDDIASANGSVASPATFLMVGADATSGTVTVINSDAQDPSFSFTASSVTYHINRLSKAEPATYLVGTPQADSTGGTEVETTPELPPPEPPAPLTEEEFLDWLEDETAIRVVLLETQCIDELGNTTLIYLSSRGYVSTPNDGVPNRAYLPLMKGGLAFQQNITLDLQGDQSYGDIELDNTEGDLDNFFVQMWQYQPARAYVGDARWPRNDFRQIFDGAIEDIDSSQRDTLNVRLRDKMYRLNMPLTEDKIGGGSAESDQLLPVCFGECHNVTPVLQDPQNLKYVFHAGQAENAFEVRDNGVPIQRLIGGGSPASFTLPRQPAGRITASVQGDNANGYTNNIADIVLNIVKNWGTESDKRFTDDDIDIANFDLFRINTPQPVGLYTTDRLTVLEASQKVAASVGARLVMTALGKLQLVRVEVPPIGTPIEVTESDMVAGSFHIANRLPLIPSVKLGYCKNWTVQEDTASGLPEEHKALFAREWLSTTVTDNDIRLKFNLWAEPEREDTLLLTQDDAGFEAGRRLWLRKVQRHVYEFVGFANLMFTQVGAPMRITHRRFGMENGKTGQVVSVAVDWLHSTVTIQVVI